ncbi:MAG: chitobiase/beta-hexosaminidase C-terminal domain-containing protein [Lachnospiraceae bacterium]|nr:chitobiase/beta-hexosaminidase C-terminal domain-containing protein [Lachnospiraceae bacterium]
MKCPNCGAEMQEGLLYCEQCGEDIHIVPDFEPEFEQNIEQNLKDIVKEVSPPSRQLSKGSKAPKSDKIQAGRRKIIAGWAMLVFFVAAVIWIGVKIVQYYSAEYQIEQAVKSTNSARYEDAIHYYERAMELEPTNTDLKLSIAQVYFLKNDKENYEYWLRAIIEDPRTEQEQLESIYGKLIAIYCAREEYQAIHDMLINCPLASIRTTYQNYIAERPQFSVPSGEYEEVKALKMTASGGGKIYYTLDGETPDASKTQYVSPILMEDGDFTVKAVYINENGVQSQVASAWYHITVTELEAPEINLDGGEYDLPYKITVTNNSENIYYTTNGTTPTKNSAKYTGPIPLPLGESHFSFARLESSNSSAVVERTFILSLRTDITPNGAEKLVREYALKNGRILDEAGHFDDTSEHYLFEYLYVTDWKGKEAVYLFAEVLVDEAGGIARTGNYYVVDVYTGEIQMTVM